ncbi:MAG: transcriptional regulator [Planctomycetes bacterium]|nr:transcriptional regulator [Planctomycetota bacterium]
MAERRPAPRKDSASGLRALRGGAIAGESFDKLIHEPIRLAIVSTLAVHDSLSFRELRDMLGATDGNLSVHARKLEESGYLSCKKGFDGRVPRTEYALSASGRRALERYLEHMEALIKAVKRP